MWLATRTAATIIVIVFSLGVVLGMGLTTATHRVEFSPAADIPSVKASPLPGTWDRRAAEWRQPESKRAPRR